MGQLILGAFLFIVWSCEYPTTPRGENKQTSILRKGDIRFYRKWRELLHSIRCIHLANKVSQKSNTKKNGIKNATVTQWRTCKHIFPVKIWANNITRLESHPGTLDDTPVNTVSVENHKATITSQMTIKIIRSVTLFFGEERLGFSHKEVSTHSPQSGFAMDLFLATVYPETIKHV